MNDSVLQDKFECSSEIKLVMNKE